MKKSLAWEKFILIHASVLANLDFNGDVTPICEQDDRNKRKYLEEDE